VLVPVFATSVKLAIREESYNLPDGAGVGEKKTPVAIPAVKLQE